MTVGRDHQWPCADCGQVKGEPCPETVSRPKRCPWRQRLTDKAPQITGAELIVAERRRQIDGEGWSATHDDDEHDDGGLLGAAFCYVDQVLRNKDTDALPGRSWPWNSSWWKPSADPVRNLVKAGALIAAEIDRLQRTEPSA